MPRPLPEGVYEHLITRALSEAIDQAAPARATAREIERPDLPSILARHIQRETERALRDSGKVEDQLALVESLLARLAELSPALFVEEQQVIPPARVLEAIYRTAEPPRPQTPLASTTLLTRNRAEPALGYELAREAGSADAIDILSSFITVGGVRVVRDALEAFARRGGKLRVLTSVFTGTTEVGAVDALARLPGAEVRVSYDVRRTRLHAKAWLFHRNTELHTAYIGSANLTATALGTGHEWMVKLCAADLPHVIDKFRGTFASLCSDSEFETYDPGSEEHRARLRSALRAERSSPDAVIQLFTLRPFPFQQEILDRLEAERSLHARHRNLLVAATGTGKTVIAAFDYARQTQGGAGRPRLLFVAHRREIIEQARATFRQVVRDGAFGEVLGDGETPERWEYVFATVQTAAHVLPARVDANHFDFVVIDECHHAPADSYQRLIRHLQPRILLGLTATPERSDGKSLLPDFDDRIAAELRLWHALDRQLLVPFEYYGVSDGTDLTNVRWSRTGYDAADLARVYTGNNARVDLIIEQLRRRVMDVRSIRALAFCVSVEHAEYMARALTERGVPAVAVHGGTAAVDRDSAPGRLASKEVNVLCTCDLYNEGVDLPFVDTLLLLRPTSSATLFIQQLGRGLRVHDNKSSCLVLDFIGQHHSRFNFDAVYSALTGVPRAKLARAVKDGFPMLPSGCAFDLDAVARDRVLAALRGAIATRARLVAELREADGRAGPVDLRRFLAETGRDLEDVYERGGGWTTLREEAGALPPSDEETRDLSRRLGFLLHVDEVARLRAWSRAAENVVAPADARRCTMLDFQLNPRGELREPLETASYLSRHPAICQELRELCGVLEEQIGLAEELYPVADWPLALHRRYSQREILVGVGELGPGERGKTLQGGILKLSGRREILLVTLDKSSSSFSPTTRYRDYAISPSVFHWETQTAASVLREAGRRYTESPENGWTFFLFVREDPDSTFAFLGPARRRAHEGDKPIAITWDLEQPMPAALFERFATLVQT